MSIDQGNLHKYFKKEGQDAKVIFQRLVKSGLIDRFRNIWGLPPDGFSNANNYQKWQREFLIKRTNNFLRSEEYRQMQAEMQRKKQQWADNKITRATIDEYGSKMTLKTPSFKFKYDIEAIMSALGLPERYKYFIEMSLVLKQPPHNSFPLDRPMPRPFLITDPKTGRKKLLVEASGETKLKDFRSKLFAYNFRRLQPKVYDYGTIKKLGVPKFDIWEQLSKWRNEGKLLREIRNLAEKELGYFIKNDENLKTYLKRHKKRLTGGTRKKKV